MKLKVAVVILKSKIHTWLEHNGKSTSYKNTKYFRIYKTKYFLKKNVKNI